RAGRRPELLRGGGPGPVLVVVADPRGAAHAPDDPTPRRVERHATVNHGVARDQRAASGATALDRIVPAARSAARLPDEVDGDPLARAEAPGAGRDRAVRDRRDEAVRVGTGIPVLPGNGIADIVDVVVADEECPGGPALGPGGPARRCGIEGDASPAGAQIPLGRQHSGPCALPPAVRVDAIG